MPQPQVLARHSHFQECSRREVVIGLGSLVPALLACGSSSRPTGAMGTVVNFDTCAWQVLSVDRKPDPQRLGGRVDRDWENMSSKATELIRMRLKYFNKDASPRRFAQLPFLKSSGGNAYFAIQPNEFVATATLVTNLPPKARLLERKVSQPGRSWQEYWAIFVVRTADKGFTAVLRAQDTRWFPDEVRFALPPI